MSKKLPLIKRFVDEVLMRSGYIPRERNATLTKSEFEEYDPYQQSKGVNLPANASTLTDVYHNSSWVYAAVYAIATHIASIPIKFYRQNNITGELKPLERTHYLWDLFQHPNDRMSGYDLIESTMTYLELNGNAYWETEKAQNGNIANIYILRADKMRPIPSPKRRTKGYFYKVSSSREIFLDDDIITQFRYFNPQSELLGLSPMEAAIAALTLDFYSVGSSKDLFKNSGKLEGVLQTEGTLSDSVYERIRTRWEQTHKGVGKHHRTAILEEGLKYKNVQISPKELEFIAQRKFSREEILAVYGVPPIVVGLLEKASWANAREQRFQFAHGVLVPKTKKIEGILNNSFLPKIEAGIIGLFDLTAVPALSEDLDKQAERLKGLVTSGILRINEARKMMGQEPVTWGNVWWTPANLVPNIQAEEDISPPDIDTEEDETEEDEQFTSAETANKAEIEYTAGDEFPILKTIRDHKIKPRKT